MIAEDPVEAQPEKSVDLARVLGVPAQASDAEPTKERHQAPAPVRLGEVDGVYSGVRQIGGPPFQPPRDALEAGRVDEDDLRIQIPPPGQELWIRMAEPELVEGFVIGGHAEDVGHSLRLLDVQRKGDPGSHHGVEVSQRRNCWRQVLKIEVRNGPATEPPADPLVVVKDWNPVRRTPDITL